VRAERQRREPKERERESCPIFCFHLFPHLSYSQITRSSRLPVDFEEKTERNPFPVARRERRVSFSLIFSFSRRHFSPIFSFDPLSPSLVSLSIKKMLLAASSCSALLRRGAQRASPLAAAAAATAAGTRSLQTQALPDLPYDFK